ncbi:MAG: hypothetical protein Q4G04_02850 [bacterium]|nr:hypothetical protein [bacterium]
MKSRMDKYVGKQDKMTSRSVVHADAYKQAFGNNYQDEILPVSNNINEIDLKRLKNIITTRDEYQKVKDYSDIVEIPKIEQASEEVKECVRVYDINELLDKAKRQNDGNQANALLSKTEYNLLKKLQLEDADNQYEETRELRLKRQEAKVGEDIEKTLSRTTTLSLDILTDLKDEKTRDITKVLPRVEESKSEEEFYSDSYTFSKKDFDGVKEKKKFKIILIVLLLIILVAGVIFAILYLGNFDFLSQ